MPKKQPPQSGEDTGVRNVYEKMPSKFLPKVDNPNFSKHGFSLPFRAIIVASSGSGKSSFLFNLIEKFSSGVGTFDSITIVTANKDEPIYNYLQDQCKAIRIVEGMRNTPILDDYDKSVSHLLVWDDLVLNKNQTAAEEYFLRARKMNVSLVYISQSWYACPLMVRKNTNYMVMLKLAGIRDARLIMKECALGVTHDTLMKIYEYATDTHMVPLIIDTAARPENRFRKGFNIKIDPADFL